MVKQMKNANSPASPVKPEVIQGNHQVHLGLTKREECAMRNLQGILANPEFHKKEDAQTMIDFAVDMADALLKELAK